MRSTLGRLTSLGAFVVGTLVVTLLVALAVQGARVREGSGTTGPADSGKGEQLRQLAAPTVGPLTLSPAQANCVQRLPGGAAAFRALDSQHQKAALGDLKPCIDREEHRLAGLPAAAVTPFRSTPYPYATAGLPGKPAGAGAIYQNGNVPSGGGVYHYSTEWEETGSGWSIRVFAGVQWVYETPGVDGIDRSQGILSVVAQGAVPSPRVGTSGLYKTPTQHGGVDVVDAVGETLKLQAKDGTVFYFDVASRQYVSGFPAGVAVPGATPPATAGP